MRPILAAALAALFVLAVSARPDDRPEKARDWSWLRPGATGRQEAIDRAGKPDIVYRRALAKGVLDLDPRDDHRGPFDFSPRPRRRDTLAVEVFQYTRRGEEAHDNLLVFCRDKLLYALVRPAEEEITVSAIEGRYGAAQPVKTDLHLGCLVTAYLVLLYEPARIGFVAADADLGCTECKQKLLWAGPKDFGPELEGVSWKLPERAAAKGVGKK